MTGNILDVLVFEGDAEADKISRAVSHLAHFLIHDFDYRMMTENYIRTNLKGSGPREIVSFTIKTAELPTNIKRMIADIPNAKDQYLVLRESVKHTISAVAGEDVNSVTFEVA